MRNVSEKDCAGNQNTLVMLNKIFPKIVAFMRYMEKYGTTGKTTNGNIIQHMRFACWITKATDTHSEYVILISFSR
jgi:hypothetical protein